MDADYIPSGGIDADEVEDIVENLEDFEEDVDAIEEKVVEEKTIFSDPIQSLLKFHPECVLDYEEDEQASIPIRTTLSEGDSYHRSRPFLSIFEKTKILGMRTNQLAQGARPFIIVPEYITDVKDIAILELEQRKLPIIIKRHMPDGSYEKFRLSDLIIL
jgi:DNA-directed RNA polymerase I, II, and III subunit RPABC2